MVNVKKLLEQKGFDYWNVKPDTTVYDALKKMAEKDVGALLVMEDHKLLGIFTERDYARKVILKGKSSKDTVVSDYMEKSILTVKPDTSIEDCMAIMTDKRVRHLPVVENLELKGIISIGDVVNAMITEQGIKIKDLEKYITGTMYGHE